ncbi:UNVERIFIED_CONTAM: hypothetical protein HHA_454280 [Hammondia hammondi]|eukprot:XP_008887703.1 hypothetical protein HHA_454280 [Hammondia hammondi]
MHTREVEPTASLQRSAGTPADAKKKEIEKTYGQKKTDAEKKNAAADKRERRETRGTGEKDTQPKRH